MKIIVRGLLLTSFVALSVAQQGPRVKPAWAFPVADKDQPVVREAPEARQMPGSTKSYTPAQIDDLLNPPDWFPEEHGPLPQIVQKGRAPDALACASCHLMSGKGHPESADISGLPVEYLISTMNDFKNGTRIDTARRMNSIAKALSDEEIHQASEWASHLKPGGWIKVVESDTPPKSYVNAKGRMRLPHPAGGTEPLGNRIIELPDDAARATSRDPKSGFTAYVPPGSIAKGSALANAAPGKTMTCSICHGEGLKGQGAVPRLAGMHPIYIVRQLSNFQTGGNTGSSAATMKKVVANLTEDDMLSLAAYASSLAP
ncbi:MAG: c-type cytochrome [Acidobacteriota bacterium]|nr:c-type cytochrome [Acidobacteriota bacterium]